MSAILRLKEKVSRSPQGSAVLRLKDTIEREPIRFDMGTKVLGTQTTTPAFIPPKPPPLKTADIVAGRELSPRAEQLKIEAERAEKEAKKTFIPQVFKETARDIGQSIARSFLATGATIDELSRSPELNILKAIKESAKKAEFRPETKFQTALAGTTEPVSFESIGREVLSIFGQEFAEKHKGLAFGTGLLMAGIDVTPFGGSKRGAFTAIKNANNLGDAMKVGQQMGIADDLLRGFAEAAVKVTDDKGAKALFENYAKLQTTTKAAPRIAPELEAGRFKIATREGVREVAPEVRKPPIESLTKVEQKALQEVEAFRSADAIAQIRSKTRGIVTDEAAMAVARQKGLTPEAIINAPIRPLLKEERFAVGGVVQNELNILRRLEETLPAARLAPDVPQNMETMRQYAYQKIKVLKLMAKERAFASEAGRSLQAEKATFDAITREEARIARFLNRRDVPQDVKDFVLAKVADFQGDPKQMAELLNKLDQATPLEMFVEMATAFKLYAIPTHIVNTLTSFIRAGLQAPLRAVAGTLDATIGKFWGGNRERFVSELFAEAQGQWMGYRHIGPHIANALMDETYALKLRKAEEFFADRAPAIKGRLGRDEWIDRFLDWVGPKVRSSFRLLGVEDVLIRRPTEAGMLYTLGAREANRKGLKFGTAEYNDFIAKFVIDPSAEVLQKAKLEGHTTLFQRDLPESLAVLNKVRNELPASKLIIPFYRTPVDLVKQFIEFSPFAPILPSVREQLKAGRGPAMDVLSKMTLGTAAIMPLTMYAMEGNITLGAPRNPAERDAFFASGKQPYSIKFGDTWYNYNRFSPFAEWFVTAGIMAEAVKNEEEKRKQEIVTDAFFSLSTAILDKTFVTGLRDALNAVSNPMSGTGQRFIQNLVVGSFIPTIVGRAAISVDPVIREVDTIKDAIQARIPFASKKLAARTDVFGEELIRPSSGIVRFISPVTPSYGELDVVRKELEDIKYNLGFPSKTAFGEELSEEEYRELKIVSGKAIYLALFKLVTSPEYQNMSPREREQTVDSVVRKIRTGVRYIVATEQAIVKQIRDGLMKEGFTEKEAEKRARKAYKKIKENQELP